MPWREYNKNSCECYGWFYCLSNFHDFPSLSQLSKLHPPRDRKLPGKKTLKSSAIPACDTVSHVKPEEISSRLHSRWKLLHKHWLIDLISGFNRQLEALEWKEGGPAKVGIWADEMFYSHWGWGAFEMLSQLKKKICRKSEKIYNF